MTAREGETMGSDIQSGEFLVVERGTEVTSCDGIQGRKDSSMCWSLLTPFSLTCHTITPSHQDLQQPAFHAYLHLKWLLWQPTSLVRAVLTITRVAKYSNRDIHYPDRRGHVYFLVKWSHCLLALWLPVLTEEVSYGVFLLAEETAIIQADRGCQGSIRPSRQ